MTEATQDARGATQGYDVQALREEFPILSRQAHDKPLVYLDNAATAQKPNEVIEAERRYYAESNSNVHRGIHALSQEATVAYESVREVVQQHLNAAEKETILFSSGVTASINLVANAWGRSTLKSGDVVLVSELEHHSNIVPWQLIAQATGASVRKWPVDDAGQLRMDQLPELLKGVKLVAVNHVSNALGTVNPIAEIIATAHAAGALVLVDGAQGVPHAKVDVQALDVDFYTFSGHKAYGPTGVGVLYGKREHLDAMPPWMGGGDMIRDVSFEETTFNVLPYKFEAGTPNIAGVVALGAALRWLQRVGVEAIAAHEDRLLAQATEGARQVPGLRIIGEAEHKASVLSFVMEGCHPNDIGTILDRRGIAVRTGHHCAQPLMQRFGVPATARASFAAYNTSEEVETFLEGLGRVQRLFA